jgi:hypothetical protein
MRIPTISVWSMEITIRWIARLLSAFFVGAVILIFIGERFNPFKLSAVEVVQMVFFWTCCMGMLAAWRWELTGGCIATGAMVLFYITEYVVTGHFPHGLAFRLLLLPGILFILSGIIKTLRRKRAYMVGVHG